MALFDKKKKKEDDFDSPVEEINLSAPPTPGLSSPPIGATAAPPPPEPAPPKRPVNFGIDKAIELMRLLPADNIELVVRVVKTTLESTGLVVTDIIEDAKKKEQTLEARVSVLNREITDLEAEIATRREEIARHEADHKETSTVKDRLILAEKLSGGGGAAAGKDAKDAKPAAKDRKDEPYAAIETKPGAPR